MDEQNANAESSATKQHTRATGFGTLGTHPMREAIIDALLKGEPATRIKAWVKPVVSHVTICKLAKELKEQASVAQTLQKVARIEAIVGGEEIKGKSLGELTKAAVLGSRHLERIAQHQTRLDAALAGAESASDIATLIKTDLQGVRLAAELDGSLAQAGPQTGNTYNVVILPPPGQQLAGEVIDAEFTDAELHDK